MGSDYTESCDLYSYGIIFYEIFSGRVPFSEYDDVMRLIEMKQAVLVEPFLRPTMPDTAPRWTTALAARLRHNNADMRPSFKDCMKIIMRDSRAKASFLADNLPRRLPPTPSNRK